MWRGVNRWTVTAEIRRRLEDRQGELFASLAQSLEPSAHGGRSKLNISFDEWTCIGVTSWSRSPFPGAAQTATFVAAS